MLRWFLNELRTDIGIDDGVGWTFILDRQKGLVSALEEKVSGAENRYCPRHLYQNFNQKFKGKELKDLFWKAASSTNPQDFNRTMEELEKADPKVGNTVNAAGWLRKISPHLWSRSHFGNSCRSDILVNNLNESFNAYILQVRDKSIVEWIRRRIVQCVKVKKRAPEDGSATTTAIDGSAIVGSIPTTAADCFAIAGSVPTIVADGSAVAEEGV
ncbi:hypothetical protein ACH5RR_018054 [Cinchona calisaya]|uniref:Transposase n=1 Tax=Cinchona calisaya TaxID=153742 RepID=A0ABD2ZKC5_9GENT